MSCSILYCIFVLSTNALACDTAPNARGIVGDIIGTVGSLTDTITDTIKEGTINITIPFTDKITPIIREYIYNKVYFVLYNEEYPSGNQFQLSNYEDVNFNIAVTSKILVHGWENDKNSGMPVTLKNEYVKLHKYNVVVVDWSAISKNILYPIPANGTTIVGECIGDLLLNLYENSSNPEINVHLIGFSLGAHVVGYAGRKLRQHKFIAQRITGLDPAKPLILDGLAVTDAAFVDVIHTSSGTLGIGKPTGDADFYPNGGTIPQPHCLNPLSDITFSLACSHSRSWEYFARTIRNPRIYPAFKCGSYSKFTSGDCDNHKQVYMGEELPRDTKGLYYLDIYRVS